MRLRTPAFAFLVVLAGPALCAAGPIDFSYAVTGGMVAAPDGYTPGPVRFTLDAGGNVQFPASGGSIAIGRVEFDSSPGPQAADTYTAYTRFEVAVRVTEQTTGRSATLSLAGGAVDDWVYRAWDGRWLNTAHKLDLGDPFAGGTAATSARLGHGLYTLSVRPEDDGRVGVYTLTATAHNPEPGTLALGLLALAPLGLRRVWRAGTKTRPT